MDIARLGGVNEFPWVQGYFQDRSLPVGVTQLTPIRRIGDPSLLQGNRFVAPESGVYLLATTGNQLPTAQANKFMYINSSEHPVLYHRLRLDGNGDAMPPISVIGKLPAGGYLLHTFQLTVAVTAFAHQWQEWNQREFWFGRIA